MTLIGAARPMKHEAPVFTTLWCLIPPEGIINGCTEAFLYRIWAFGPGRERQFSLLSVSPWQFFQPFMTAFLHVSGCVAGVDVRGCGQPSGIDFANRFGHMVFLSR